jgi:cytochrome c peroxidase
MQAAPQSEAPVIGHGDDRAGYETVEYRSQSAPLRPRGERLDLTTRLVRTPLGLPPYEGEVPTAAMVDLGRRLFFDRRLSANGTLSCGMCHVPEQAFTQRELATPVGFQGLPVKRNAPALFNVAYRPRLFFDGREPSLELQIWSPLLAANEMANPSMGGVIERIAAIDTYAAEFRSVFGTPPDVMNVGRAIAAYERGLVSADSPFDRWHFGGDTDAVTEDAKRGFARFLTLGCNGCHLVGERHAHFTDDGYHDTGIGYAAAMAKAAPRRVPLAPGVSIEIPVPPGTPTANDLGRYHATLDPADRWRFRTPSLRNVALTAPYMHDGSLATLDAVLDHYAGGGAPHEGQDPRIVPFPLEPSVRAELNAFLQSLTGSDVEALAADARSVEIGDH